MTLPVRGLLAVTVAVIVKELPHGLLALVVDSVIDVGPGGAGVTGPPPPPPPPPHPRASETIEKAAKAAAARNLFCRPGIAANKKAASSTATPDPHGILPSGATIAAGRGLRALCSADPMGVMLSVTETGLPLRLTEAGLSEML